MNHQFLKELQFEKKSNLAASSLYKLQLLHITKKLVIGIWFGTFWAKGVELFRFTLKCLFSQGLLNRWTSQLDLECTTGGLERVVTVHNFGAP